MTGALITRITNFLLFFLAFTAKTIFKGINPNSCSIVTYCNTLNGNTQYVLLKALPPVCMKYTPQGESRVANIAGGAHINVQIKHSSLIVLNKGIAQINGFL